LGARYVLEGTVRKAGGRVRITTQLIDAINARTYGPTSPWQADPATC
jgi:TolB-like protein